MRTAKLSAQHRFICMFDLYLDAVIQQAEDRTQKYIRDIQSYFDIRRDTIGLKPSFAITEMHLNIADEVLEDPIIITLTSTSIDMVLIANDLYSYNVEWVSEQITFDCVNTDFWIIDKLEETMVITL